MTQTELRQARQSLGMTQRKFAEALGVHVNHITRWETGLIPVSRQTELAVRYLQITAK